MARAAYLVALALAALISFNAPAVLASERGPGMGQPGPGMEGPGLSYYEQAATIAPTRVNGYFIAVFDAFTPLNGNAFLTYDSDTTMLQGGFQLTFSGMGEPGINLQGSLSVTEDGMISVRSDGPSMSTESMGTFIVNMEFDDGENYTMVDASFDYEESSVSLAGNYSTYTLTVQGPVTLAVIVPSQGLNLSVIFDFYLDVMVESSMAEEYALITGTMIVDFNTGDPMTDSGYAFMLATMIQQIIVTLGLEDNVTVTTDPGQGSVKVDFTLYLTPDALQGIPVPGAPGMPGMPGPGAGMPFNMTNMTFPISLESLTVDADISYNAGLDVQVSVTPAEASAMITGSVIADGVPYEAVGLDSIDVTLYIDGDEESNETVVQGTIAAEGFSDPVLAFYFALKAAIDAAGEAESLMVTFRGEEGVMFGFDGPEYEVVVFTEANATLMEDLKLYYNGTGFAVEEDTLIIEGGDGATVTLPPATTEVVASGAKSLELKVAPSAAVARISELEVEFAGDYGTIVLGLENASVAGSLKLRALDPAEASSLLPPGLQAVVVGPGVEVEGVAGGEGYVEIPLVRTPENPALIRLTPDGGYEVITDVKVENGRLEAEVPGFSTLIPVDLAASEQPPPGDETTTTETETETGTPGQTTTTPEQTETETMTETPEQTATETEPHTETETMTETPEHTPTMTMPPYTTTTPEAGTTETTEETQTPEQTAATTPPAGGTVAESPAPEDEGGVSTTMIAALAVVIGLAAVAAFLMRR